MLSTSADSSAHAVGKVIVLSSFAIVALLIMYESSFSIIGLSMMSKSTDTA